MNKQPLIASLALSAATALGSGCARPENERPPAATEGSEEAGTGWWSPECEDLKADMVHVAHTKDIFMENVLPDWQKEVVFHYGPDVSPEQCTEAHQQLTEQMQREGIPPRPRPHYHAQPSATDTPAPMVNPDAGTPISPIDVRTSTTWTR